ncbi:hypothetical protein LSH36_13g14049, partial [Paralvinella palmiformis]
IKPLLLICKSFGAITGPNRHTMADFWEMVWQENVHCIVMATNLFEHARVIMCCDNTFTLSGILLSIGEKGSDLFWRLFSNSARNTGTISTVNMATYTFGWRHRIYLLTSISGHLECKRSCTRVQETYPCIHQEQARTYPCTLWQQYEFIYDMVAMYLQCGITVINAKQLPYVVQDLALKLSHSKCTGFEREFKTLQNVVPKLSVGECAGGHRAENRRKTRDIMIQPRMFAL